MRAASAAVAGVATHEEQCREDTESSRSSPCLQLRRSPRSRRRRPRADTTADAGGAVSRGGTYRVEWESSFDFTSGFDPTGEYSVQAFGIYSNLLVRTLVGYDHVAGPAGNVLVPDLATSLGTISNGGRTYTFTLKRGIRFGPPLEPRDHVAATWPTRSSASARSRSARSTASTTT